MHDWKRRYASSLVLETYKHSLAGISEVRPLGQEKTLSMSDGSDIWIRVVIGLVRQNAQRLRRTGCCDVDGNRHRRRREESKLR